MRRTALNHGWEFRPKQNRHAEMTGQGAPWEPVTLPLVRRAWPRRPG